MLIGFLLRTLIVAAGLWVAARFVPGIRVDSVSSLAAAALVLGVINAIVRPIVFILTLPLTVLTLGLFLLVINAAMLLLTAQFLHGFHVYGFGAALWGSIVVSLVSWVGSILLQK
jgi:putative membrane protein